MVLPVYPWTLKEVQKDKAKSIPKVILSQIIRNLASGNYQINKWIACQNRPSDSATNATSRLVSEIEKCREENKNPPWFLLLSNNTSLLNELGEVLPITYALTVRCGVRTIRTEHLISLLSSPGYSGIWGDDPDPSVEPLERIYFSGLLFWQHWASVIGKAREHQGEIYNMLDHRASRNLPTVFTSYVRGGIGLKAELKGIQRDSLCLGTAASNMIFQNSSIVNLRKAQEESPFHIRNLDV